MAFGYAPLPIAIPGVMIFAIILLKIGNSKKIKSDSAIALISSSALAIGVVITSLTTGLNTGARFMGTIHSNDAASSVTRLAQCARYKSDYPMETLEEMLTAVPFVLIHMEDFSVTEIVEIAGFDYQLQQLKFNKVYRKGR